MRLRDQVHAIRHSVAVSRLDHVHPVWVWGDEAFGALNAVVASDLRLRDGQMIQSLLLEEDGRVLADLHLACDDQEFLVLADGPEGAQLAAHLERHLARPGVEWEDRGATTTLIGLDGPYAWELLALLLGADVVGLPYLTCFRFEGGFGFRAGRTGEYGYGLLVERERAEELMARLADLGRPLDVAEASREALEQCARENWMFDIRREGRAPVTPVELQLQWRLSSHKAYVGSEAVARRRRALRQRLTCLLPESDVATFDPVSIEGTAVGTVVNSGYSDTLERWIALALIDLHWAHSGLDAFRVRTACGEVGARSVSPPLLNNRSLHVSPQIHSYATRHEFQFPPLARELDRAAARSGS